MICDKIDEINTIAQQNNENPDIYQSSKAIIPNTILFDVIPIFLKYIFSLEYQCLIYVEAGSIKKFLIDNFFKAISFERLIQFSFVCLDFIKQNNNSIECSNNIKLNEIINACDCIIQILNVQSQFNEIENYFTSDKCHSFFEALLDVSYDLVHQHLAENSFTAKNQLKLIMQQQIKSNTSENSETEVYYAKAIFLGKFIEHFFQNDERCHLDIEEQNAQFLIRLKVSNDNFFSFFIQIN